MTSDMTYTNRVAATFTAHPRTWISAVALMRVGGLMAWRTRVSDCRIRGMAIENRLRRRKNGSIISEYRYTP
jgi:hypothetical protein